MPGDAPEAAVKDLAVACLDVFWFDDAEELAVRPPFEGVFLHIGAARDGPAKEEEGSGPDEPDVGPCRGETGVGVGRHAPEREDEKPTVDDQAAPEEHEAEPFVDEVVGVELDALEDEVVEDVEGEEGGVKVDARIGVVAEAFVMVGGAGEGVEREHSPANDVEVHLDVEAVIEEGELPGAAGPQSGDGVPVLALRLSEYRDDGENGREDGASGHGVDG